MTALPFVGLRVVALEQAVAAPFCSRQLADLGADVIKVERPDGGDFARGYDSTAGGTSSYFAWLNRGKRSIALDLKAARDGAICARLVERADVFVHNLAPGAVERLGFGYDALAARHPRLIWCGISGYGPDGPYRDRKAYDLLVQSEAGVLSLTGTPERPAKAGVAIADIGAGLYAYSSILAALYRRERTGAGGRIDISMLECVTEWLMPPLYFWHGTGKSPAREGMRHNTVVPYGVYECADGAVNLSIQNEREWRRFCAIVLEQPLCYEGNAARLEHRAEVEGMIEAKFRGMTAEALRALLERAEIAQAAVNDMAAVARHPQLAARGRWAGVEAPGGTIPALVPPHNLLGATPAMGRVPALGEHTREILEEIAAADESR